MIRWQDAGRGKAKGFGIKVTLGCVLAGALLLTLAFVGWVQIPWVLFLGAGLIALGVVIQLPTLTKGLVNWLSS